MQTVFGEQDVGQKRWTCASAWPGVPLVEADDPRPTATAFETATPPLAAFASDLASAFAPDWEIVFD